MLPMTTFILPGRTSHPEIPVAIFLWTPIAFRSLPHHHLHPATLTFRSLPLPPFAPRHPHVPEPSPAVVSSGRPLCPECLRRHLPQVPRSRNPILQLLLSPGIQMVPIVSYLVLRVSLSFIIAFSIELCCHFYFRQTIFISPLFLKCFELSKESISVIPNNGVIGIGSSKMKWVLVGTQHM